ncbi:UDP-N-acetylmuramate dehydrogenase [Candidatus Saccharibacteria bacterium]|nr:UDP-N-acetylmuramate dehydrogenase [Candidatus Saccharibacteria bacterium]
MKYQENVSLATLTTMQLGGFAKYVVEITTEKDLVAAIEFARERDLPWFVLGGGSNVIGRDDGFDGVIFLNKIKGIEVVSRNNNEFLIKCGSGEILDDLVAYSVSRGLTGIEAMSAIPGTVGGAVFQNSGAYGQDLSQVLVNVTAYDSEKQTFVVFDYDQLNLSYRQSIFNSSAKSRYFITTITIKLRPGQITGELYKSLQIYLNERGITDRDPATIRRAVTDIRAGKLPDPAVEPSAGSFFHNVTLTNDEATKLRAEYPNAPIFTMNSQEVLAAGWLIEQCGLKGKVLHGMRVSDKAALILINDHARNYADLAAAREEILATVKTKFNVTLEQEPENL